MDLNTENPLIKKNIEFSNQAQLLFDYQIHHNAVFQKFHSILNSKSRDFTYLPIEFFKTHDITCLQAEAEALFMSSGTTQTTRSVHKIFDLNKYLNNARQNFEYFYGAVEEFTFLCLLPNYLEQGHSSLVAMCEHFVSLSSDSDSGFFLHDVNKLHEVLLKKEKSKKKTILIGVTYALLDFAELFPIPLENTLVMETGGMKGRRREMVREEVHALLSQAFKVDKIHSEYGMTELQSQAYSQGDGVFQCPPTLHIEAVSPTDYFEKLDFGKTGLLRIIDLANENSCAFIQTQDLGKIYKDGSFEVIGRHDYSEQRGCNLMIG